MRKPLLILALLLLAAPARAQITIPNTFTNGTVADANDVNANFAALGNQALNRTGGTMTGDLLFNDALYDIGKVSATRPRDGFFSRNLTVGGVLTAASISSGGTLVLTGPVTTGNLTVGGTLGVTGATTLSSSLSAGATTLNSLGVVNTATITGTLTAGASTLASMAATGAATVGTTLTVTGAATVGGTLGVTGVTTVGTLNATTAVLSSGMRAALYQVGGGTAAFPAWRNTGAQMEAVLADQSNWATVQANNFYSVATGNNLGDLTVRGNANIVGGVTIGSVSVSGGASVPFRFAIRIPGGSYSAVAGDFVLMPGAGTVTLPAATSGAVIDVKNYGAGAVTVAASSGLIDGLSTYVLSVIYQSVTVVGDGTNWWVR